MRRAIKSARAWMMNPGAWELTDEQKREDAYWGAQDDDEAAEAENWLRHMEEQTESKQ